MALVGRLSERQALEKLLDAATAGLSAVLVLRGEAGFGKTALLDAAAEAAALKGIQIARLTGVESETQLGYAGLHRLLLPYADHIDHLPGPRARCVAQHVRTSERACRPIYCGAGRFDSAG